MSTKKSGGMKCAYKNCENTSVKTNLSFFAFPVGNRGRCMQWIINSGREDFAELDETKLRFRTLCSEHFLQSAFTNHLRNKLLRNHPAAVPIPWSPDLANRNKENDIGQRKICTCGEPALDEDIADVGETVQDCDSVCRAEDESADSPSESSTPREYNYCVFD